MPWGRPHTLPPVLPSDWRVRFFTDGSVSRHLNRKSSPSLTVVKALRGVTNTLAEWAGSEREELQETRGHFKYSFKGKKSLH